MHCWGPSDLANAIERSHSIILERLWQSRGVLEDLAKAKAILIFKKGREDNLGNHRLVSLTSIWEKPALVDSVLSSWLN